MKLRGIRDSKGRRQVHERNQNYQAPAASAGLDPHFHQPKPGERGTLICSCGSALYTPAAFAQHLACTGPKDMENGVLTSGAYDAWLQSQQANPDHIQRVQESMDAEQRAESVDAYYAKQTRARARIVEGVAGSITD